MKKILFILLLLVYADAFTQRPVYVYQPEAWGKDAALTKDLVDSTIKMLKKRLLNSGYTSSTVTYNSDQKEFRVESNSELEDDFARKWLIKSCEVFFYEIYDPAEFASILLAGDGYQKRTDDKRNFLKLLNFKAEMNTGSRIPNIGIVKKQDADAFNKLKKKLDTNLPVDCLFAYSQKVITPGDTSVVSREVYALRNNEWKLPVHQMLRSATPGSDGRGRPVIQLRFNETGQKSFARLTMKNVGRAIAIVVDGLVYSAPYVNGSIEGGVAEISGYFTKEEAKQFASMLSSGSLPLRLVLIK